MGRKSDNHIKRQEGQHCYDFYDTLASLLTDFRASLTALSKVSFSPSLVKALHSLYWQFSSCAPCNPLCVLMNPVLSKAWSLRSILLPTIRTTERGCTLLTSLTHLVGEGYLFENIVEGIGVDHREGDNEDIGVIVGEGPQSGVLLLASSVPAYPPSVPEPQVDYLVVQLYGGCLIIEDSWSVLSGKLVGDVAE